MKPRWGVIKVLLSGQDRRRQREDHKYMEGSSKDGNRSSVATSQEIESPIV